MPYSKEIPTDHVGIVLKLMGCNKHGAHINMDYHLPRDLQGARVQLTDLIELDQMTPTQARNLAKDLNEIADACEAEVAKHN